jgi:NTP pyrophosphatase (non-canonical NTP hydrolase)
MKTLNKLRDEIHENAVKHGFYEDESCAVQTVAAEGAEGMAEALKHAFFAQRIALIHSELSEALEADRKGKRADMSAFQANITPDGIFNDLLPENVAFEKFIKDTVPDELADVIIRTLCLCGRMGIDIERHVELKMKYNESREYKHGKNC